MDELILDIGCGHDKQPGAWGVDIANCKGVDQVFDLEKTPWPLPSDQFAVVYALQVLEHLSGPEAVMMELYRVCMHGALVFVQVPNGFCPGYAQDPTHKKAWNLGGFLYFCPGQWPSEWHERIEHKTHFKVLHYHTTGQKAGRTPWGDTLFADNLTVILQVIKVDDNDAKSSV
jgi:SAM-dependent methyltransferase